MHGIQAGKGVLKALIVGVATGRHYVVNIACRSSSSSRRGTDHLQRATGLLHDDLNLFDLVSR